MASLPPALAARLLKRGLIPKESDETPTHFEHHEEVIAEDYDDLNKCVDSKGRYVVIGCPNKYNIYHDCNYYCQKRWSSVRQEPSPKTRRKYNKLLKRYPLIDGWQEVYDPGVKCFYYWNTNSDEVSWLPPHHPNARISLSAEKLRSLLRDDDDDADDDGSDATNSDNLSDSYDSDSDLSEKGKSRRSGDNHAKRSRDRNPKGRPNRKANDLDPMDPASYSEIPRGKWSDGLEKKGDAKTGVDATATGPLFQMRPYPNPGAVLRMNSKKRNKDSSSDED